MCTQMIVYVYLHDLLQIFLFQSMYQTMNMLKIRRNNNSQYQHSLNFVSFGSVTIQYPTDAPFHNANFPINKLSLARNVEQSAEKNLSIVIPITFLPRDKTDKQPDSSERSLKENLNFLVVRPSGDICVPAYKFNSRVLSHSPPGLSLSYKINRQRSRCYKMCSNTTWKNGEWMKCRVHSHSRTFCVRNLGQSDPILFLFTLSTCV